MTGAASSASTRSTDARVASSASLQPSGPPPPLLQPLLFTRSRARIAPRMSAVDWPLASSTATLWGVCGQVGS
jgi:hypothetical protein